MPPNAGRSSPPFTPRKTHTDEVAVMLDARDALVPGDLPEGVEFTGYVDSWKGNT